MKINLLDLMKTTLLVEHITFKNSVDKLIMLRDVYVTFGDALNLKPFVLIIEDLGEGEARGTIIQESAVVDMVMYQ